MAREASAQCTLRDRPHYTLISLSQYNVCLRRSFPSVATAGGAAVRVLPVTLITQLFRRSVIKFRTTFPSEITDYEFFCERITRHLRTVSERRQS